jgi:hypothetical protein
MYEFRFLAAGRVPSFVFSQSVAWPTLDQQLFDNERAMSRTESSGQIESGALLDHGLEILPMGLHPFEISPRGLESQNDFPDLSRLASIRC